MQPESKRGAVGFVGLGAMGWPMAARLVAHGFDVVVHDLRGDRAAKFAAEIGGRQATRLAEIGEAADFVITMLPNSDVVEDVLFGSEPLASNLAPETLLIEMSSGAPRRTLDIAARLDQFEVSTIDAPVSGGVARARTGDLAIMVGGSADRIDQARPILSAIGSTIVTTGALGSAHAMKALNNLVSAGGFLIALEALLVGKKFGLDPKTMLDILNASSGMNNSTQKKFAQFVLSGTFASGFSLDLMVKDLSTALDLGRGLEIDAPFSQCCRSIWAQAIECIGHGHDHTELARIYEEEMKVDLREGSA